jgi:hypothetical protein
MTLLLALLVAGCARGNATPEGEEVAAGDAPVVVIDSPATGVSIPTGQIIEISSTATSEGSSVQRIEMYINGDLIADDPTPDAAGQPSFSVVQRWVPVEPGRAEVAVYAYSVDGTRSRPASIILEVGGDGVASPQAGEPGEETTDPVTDTAPVTETETEPEPEATEEPTEEAEPSPTAESEEGEGEEDEGETAEPSGPEVPAIITAEGGLNVRAGPAVDAERVDGVLLGERVTAIGINAAGDWIRIRHGEGDDEGEGWVAAEFVDLEGDAATLPVLE